MHDIDPRPAPEASRAAAWAETRMPFVAAFRREYVDFPMPRNLNVLWNFGAFLTVSLGLLLLSGVFLAIAYTPDVAQAFAAIEHIDRDIPSGWLVRAIHMGGVSMLFACLYVHIGRSLYYGSHKAPREILWLTGIGLMLALMATAFAGYVLPWGQMSYWGAVVVVNALQSVPLIGHPLATLLTGGEALGSVMLHRLFVLHFVMAGIAIAIVVAHVACLHVVGSNNPTGVPPRPADMVAFHPHYTSKDALGLCLFLLVYAVLIFFLPGLLTLAQNYVAADPLATPADITPEWYFAPFYAILRAVPSKLGGLMAASGSIVVLAAAPWLDRSRIRAARHRPGLRPAFALLVAAFAALGYAGMHAPEGVWLWVSRIATLIYYAYFLVALPLLPAAGRLRANPETSATTPRRPSPGTAS